MMPIQIELRRSPSLGDRPVEIVERKGLGHPDTICDMLCERFSVALSKYYLERFGLVLHHNVDKALLSAGRSEPAFGGGRVLRPFDFYLSGRATIEMKGERVPVRDLAEAAIAAWLQQHLHAFDAATGIRLHCLAQPGSADLTELFARQRERGVLLAMNRTRRKKIQDRTNPLERSEMATSGRLPKTTAYAHCRLRSSAAPERHRSL
jgi:S-adenosylmethionine synthetase